MAERRPTVLVPSVILAACVALAFGWWHLWFLTDDAFIAFRYVSNSVSGQGYTWNPAPFAPVEGYTSFLWVVILDVVWRATGIAPPESANLLSLLCGLGSVLLLARLALRQLTDVEDVRARAVMLGLVLLGIVSNRTFITWTTSGLETALFVLLLTAWLAAATRQPAGDASWVFGIALVSSLLALCRPDGLLFWGCGALILLLCFSARREAPRARELLRGLPLALVPLHLLWRLTTYDQWLPNTYYAKSTTPWPEAGTRYLWSFVLEYGLLAWGVLGVAAAVVWWRRRAPTGTAPLEVPRIASARLALCAAPFVAQLCFYTFLTGGDHFEYRVYAQFVGPLFLFGLFAARTLSAKTRWRVVTLVALVAIEQPLPWVHYQASQKHVTRAESMHLFEPIADDLPHVFGPWARRFDEVQAWLIARSIGMRHQEHKRFWQIQWQHYPSMRGPSTATDEDDRPVLAEESVGVPGWRLPHIAILDMHGLNDRVVARGPIRKIDGKRQLSHEHWPPNGYLECFRPNVRVVPADAEPGGLEPGDAGTAEQQTGRIEIRQRARPLSAREIRACESRFRAPPRGTG